MEAMQYELARNMTLLFFFERLLDKGEPRTLHDLSCQFGSKGFTKEMRQIAGGSQSGLKKFLTQYPSLFSMEGEYVTINTFQHCGNKSAAGKLDFLNIKLFLYDCELYYFLSKKKESLIVSEVPSLEFGMSNF